MGRQIKYFVVHSADPTAQCEQMSRDLEQGFRLLLATPVDGCVHYIIEKDPAEEAARAKLAKHSETLIKGLAKGVDPRQPWEKNDDDED